MKQPNDESIKKARASALTQHLNASWYELICANNRMTGKDESTPSFGMPLTAVIMFRHVISSLDSIIKLLGDQNLKERMNKIKQKNPDWKNLRDILSHVEHYVQSEGKLQKDEPDSSEYIDAVDKILSYTTYRIFTTTRYWEVILGGGMRNGVRLPTFSLNVTEAINLLRPLVDDAIVKLCEAHYST